jgi:protein phosphatase
VAGFRACGKGEVLSKTMQRLVQAANGHVFEAALAAGRSGAGMATTLVACALRYDRATVAHVGDSRCYLVRAGSTTILTRDHTVANEQVVMGILSSKEAAEIDSKHILSRSLGGDLFVGVDVADHQLFPGDVLLLCSDGLHGSVTPHDIARVVSGSSDLDAAGRQLVLLANERDGSDNISAQLVRVLAVERVGMYRGRPYKLR